MKLLFDQNISVKIVKKLSDTFPGCTQVRLIGLENATDFQIWEYAKENGFCIVTFDTDFNDLSTLKGQPPRVVWLRIGNTSTNELEKVIRYYSESIMEFIDSDDSESACLEIKAH